MTQEETLLKTIVEKNNEITELRELLKSGVDTTGEKSNIEKVLWATLFAVCDRYVKCPKCNSRCRPITTKTNYMMLCCKRCSNIFSVAKKGKPIYSAYFTKSGRKRDV